MEATRPRAAWRPRPSPRALLTVVASTALMTVAWVAPLDAAGLGRSAADPAPEPTATPPELTPADGAFLEGTRTIAAAPTVPDDDVVRLTVDGRDVEADETVGVSHLRFDVGSNSADNGFGNYLLVNGHRIDQPRTWVSERVDLEVPNEFLTTGENVIEVVVGANPNSSCGENYDDFVLSDFSLELLGEVGDGDDNEFTYDFGDGSCGSQDNLLRAELTFDVTGDPRRTTGLSTEWDTTTVSNGEHVITATTALGGMVKHTVRVNNGPPGSPYIVPADGTLTNGTEPVLATLPADAGGDVAELTVDGAAPPTKATLGDDAATLSFDVGSNSIEDRFDNSLLVNGKRIDLGGDWTSTRVSTAIPARWLVPGDNLIKVVTGDRNSSCGVNRDDFAISDLELALAGATITGHDIAPSYEMGDGSCGSSETRRREVGLRYTIDGPAVPIQETLGSGSATLSFDVGSNSINDAFLNTVRINGMELLLGGDFASERVDLPIPNEWLAPGWNTVDIVTGPTETGCNRDDFAISDIALTPARGTATGRMIKPSYSMGDGTCGSNPNKILEIDLNFVVDTPVGGLRADVVTTELADGEHTIAATSAAGQQATRLLVTDNTAPVVTSSVPATGQRITSAVPLAVEVEDPSAVRSTPKVTLDGEPIQLGGLVGPGLSAGEHTLAVTATDSLGNTATRDVTFQSAGIPDDPANLSPASGSTGTDDTVTLSAEVAEPDGGEVSATFSHVRIRTPGQAWQSGADAIPTTLRVPGEDNVGDTKPLAPGDGATIDAPTTQGVAIQRFDIRVKGRVAAPTLRWEGVIDPERLVSLRAWNLRTSTWDVLDAARGEHEGNTVLTAMIDHRYVDGQQVHAMVTGEDPFADDIDPGDKDRFEDPADYDFAMVHFTDTQYLSEGAVEQESAAERAVWEKAYGDLTRWIKDNAGERKIAYVAHTGDITQNNIRQPTTPEERQQMLGEFEVSSEQQRILDRAGVPNGVIAGNHDNWAGRQDGPEATYNQYYGPDRYAELSKGWEHASYGGPWREGDNQNHYDLFSAGGLDFVVVGLSYGVTREEARWADSVFKRFPDRNGILLSHDYVAPSTQPDGRTAEYAGVDGSALFKQVVQPNPNVFLVLAGHYHGVGTNVKPQVGEIGGGVVEMLADYQAYTVSAERLGLVEIGGYDPTDQLRFGASFLRMLQFDVERAEMSVDTYSPFLDNFGATEFDTSPRYNGTEDNMVLPVDLTSRTTSFQTDSMALYTPTRVIGRDTVSSGEVASVRWRDLRPSTAYAWTVTARSAGGGVTSSLPSFFVTADARGRDVPPRSDDPLRPYFTRR